MDSFDFASFNDPNHPWFRSEQSVNDDVNSLLASLDNENHTEVGPNLIPQSAENEITLAAYLMDSILTKDYVEVFKNRILDLIDAFPDSAWRPKHIFSNWEAGYWISKWANEESTKWFMKIMSETPILVDNVETRLNIVPIKNLPTYKAEVLIKGQIITDDKILARFAKQNKEIELSTSRWTDLECTSAGINKYKLCLEIDLLSSRVIKANDSKLFFGMEAVNFNIYDKLEFAAMDIISLGQGLKY